jgi:hypothetical protein
VVAATDSSFAFLLSCSNLRARHLDAMKAFRDKSLQEVVRSTELRFPKYSSSWRIAKLDPASSRNLRSWPPLVRPRKRIYFPPISLASVGTCRRAAATWGSSGIMR